MAQSFLTSTSAAIQSYSVPSDWNAANNSVAGIGPGGNGSARQSSTRAGVGGGAGSYAIRANISLTGSTAIYYFLPAAGSASDAWFNDLNLLLQTNNNIGGTSWTITAATASQSQSDPFSGSLASKATENTATTGHSLTQTITGARPASVATPFALLGWIKANGSRNATFGMEANGQFVESVIDLTNGTLHSSSHDGAWTAPSISITSAGGSWYRVLLTSTVNTAGVDLRTYSDILNASFADVYTGDGSSGLFYYGWNITLGIVDKGFTPTTTARIYSILCKAGTNATTSAAGVGQAGSVGDTTAQGGDGNQPALAVTIGGGGGGAAGPSGAGGNAVTSVGGTANNATTAGGLADNNGNSGAEFDGTHGCGSGAGGRNGGAGNGLTGGSYGGAGSGCGTAAAGTGGAGAPPIFVINYTAASADTLFAQSVM